MSIFGVEYPQLRAPKKTIKLRKLTWFGHVVRHHNLPKTILQGTVEGGRRTAVSGIAGSIT